VALFQGRFDLVAQRDEEAPWCHADISTSACAHGAVRVRTQEYGCPLCKRVIDILLLLHSLNTNEHAVRMLFVAAKGRPLYFTAVIFFLFRQHR